MFCKRIITFCSLIHKTKVCVNSPFIRTMSTKSSYKQIQVFNYSTDFDKAVQIVSLPLVDPKSDQILIKNLFVGINATDLNITAGRYFKHDDPPYPLGIESLGEIVKIGTDVKNYNVGQHVVVKCGGGLLRGYSEYLYATSADGLTVIPKPDPKYLALFGTSGLTASIGLSEGARLAKGDKVLITAAAGGVGHIAAQWALLKGCHVIATTSNEKKEQFLKQIGCHRVINYKLENLDNVLKTEYPEGIDVVWETIGSPVFEQLFEHLARKGRLINIGATSGYTTVGYAPIKIDDFIVKLHYGAKTVIGFLTFDYKDKYEEYAQQLSQYYENNKLEIKVDFGVNVGEGLEAVSKGIKLMSDDMTTKMDVSEETTPADTTPMATDEHNSTEATQVMSRTVMLDTLLNGLIATKALKAVKKGVNCMTGFLDKKDLFFEIKDVYHYLCVINETSIDKQTMHTMATDLCAFFEKIIDVCYQLKCLASHYDNDYRFYNCIQHLIKCLITKLDGNCDDNNVVNQTIPTMLRSMIVVVSTIHGLQEAVVISGAITTQLVLKRVANGLCVDSNEWKGLIACLTNVSNIWKRVIDIDQTDRQSLGNFVVSLVDLSLGGDPFPSHMAAKAVKCLSHEKNIDLEQLFIEYQVEISTHILRLLDINDNFDNLGDTLKNTMSVFGINILPRELIKHIVPHFVHKCNQTTEKFVSEIARIDDKAVCDIIKIYLIDIIEYLFYSTNRIDKSFEEIQSRIDLLKLILDFDIKPRIYVTIFELMQSSLMHLSTDREATLEAIAFIQYYRRNQSDSNYDLQRFFDNEEELREVLVDFFLPFVHKFDLVIQDNSVSTIDKLKCTQSFISLMAIMGKNHLNTYRVKLFSTIKLILSERFHTNKPQMKLNVEVLMQYIQMIEPSYLADQLLTISALTLPLIHLWPQETKKVFRELIVRNKTNENFKKAFKHLYFIPDCNELKEVTDVLKQYITYRDAEKDIFLNITFVVNNINHENNRVQEFSLRELLKLLTKHQSLIYKKCNKVKELSVDYFVNKIVAKLMVCMKSNDENVLQLVAQCLGVLGAIDPLRIDLEKPIISKEEKLEKFLNANDHEFKVILIRNLYRAVTTATKTGDQNCISFTLQEIVKDLKSDGFNLDTLPTEHRDYCRLLCKTKYKTVKSIPITDTMTRQIFGSEPELQYNDWLKLWLQTLFQAFIFNHEHDCENSQYNENLSQFSGQCSQRSDLFEAELAKALTSNSIKIKLLNVTYLSLIRDQSMAQFMLPYVVITALKNATLEQKNHIVNEVKTIITKLKDSNDLMLEGEIGHLSSQTVFHIYDYLKVWHKKRVLLHKRVCSTPRHLKTARLKDREFRGVEYFLNNISTKDLSDLAFKCNAYSRSLRYLEEYVKTDEMVFQEAIPMFQEIFLRLDEPDSVVGCNSKRIGRPNINERILTHEAMGQIQEAMLCCAKAVEHNPSDLKLQQKYLQNSMENFDQSEQVYTYGCGLMARKPEWQRSLAPFVIEAVWKLGDWTQLDQILKQYDSTCLTTFGSGIGDLFNTIINEKEIEFDEKMTNLRRGLVGPLSAAATEISGYVRGHEYIVNLHILNDIQLVYNKLMAELDEDVSPIDTLRDKFSKVINIWNQRNDLVRKTVKCQEPILNAQRAMLSILAQRAESANLSLDIKKQLFKSWLMSTKTSRKSGNIQRSYTFLLEMNKIRDSMAITFGDVFESTVSPLSDLENCEAILETAKIEWNKNKIGAIQYLKSQIEQNYSSSHSFCIQRAVSKLNDSFSTEELIELRSSMSYGSASIPSYQSSMASTGGDSTRDQSTDEAFAKLQLLHAKYCEQNGLLNQNSLAILYKVVTIAAPQSEESHYNLGMFCHRIYKNYEESKRQNQKFTLGKADEILQMKGRAVSSLIESLKYGVKYAHNSLPLLLNMWFDLGSDHNQINQRSRSGSSTQQYSEEIRKTIEKINNAIGGLLANVPLYIFFIVFAQLTARVLHPNMSISAMLKRIISKLIASYPQQTMWLLMRSYNSANANRRNCFRAIVEKSYLLPEGGTDQTLLKFVSDIIKFSNLLTTMSAKGAMSGQRVPRGTKYMTLSRDFPELHRLLKSNSFSKILLPFRSLVSVTLPKSIHETNYNPFPTEDVYIHKFEDNIELLLSLQRPKKVSIVGSDGKTYTILCKPGDDLRKDYCFLEFCNLLNRCFKRDAESRKRQLRVKTYLVVSLTDTCGLIEWIPGLAPFRSIVEGQYRLKEYDYDSTKDLLIKNYPLHTLPKADRVRKFQTEILPKFQPSVFGNWFVSNFTDPLSWFAARLAYTRSSAVYSIVGYLLGLGDRHGENIMIEESTGETVHVDLNCMFNKGEEFQVPERVPFRLTHNMIHAMGVIEYEGTFRKACEHALRVARDNKEAVMNFVSPFRFDHLIEWSTKNSDVRQSSSEFTLEISDNIVFNIEARLNGIPSRNDRNLPKGVALSVEGQVDTVIKEATDINNLGVMYVGWTAYI
ncbi:unnamed protein product [Medioppia subpectinata]|uniref:Serine/threonine-protein kinase ATR n=1 Tax=Medioppia subpectinata TaxID=1979941 RepID=A0A7R9KEW2_9ACAR|nr:unnamed protein product [Medioppia subpectinata]CAG2102094.1 unnamed protein product [Medioppia subpectinata]